MPTALVARPTIGKASLVHGSAQRSTVKQRRRRPLGLRARVTVGFALAGLAVSLALSLITYLSARSYLLGQRDDVAKRQAFVNARLLRDQLRAPGATVGDLVQSVRTEGGGFVLFRANSVWYSQGGVGLSQDSLPQSLRDGVLGGQAGRQRYRFNNQPYLAVGVPLTESSAAYFEAFPLNSLQNTIGKIGTTLVLGSILTTLFAAGIGWWSSRRVLNPLSRVADAAEDLASGGLDTRLPEEGDADLDRLVTSFNGMADAVQSRIEREARFASDVSHELRSPITALTAAVEVLDGRREEVPERPRQALDVVVTQVRRFDRMVIDLLELSRMDAGAGEMHLEEVVLGEVLPRVAARYGHTSLPIVVAPPWDHTPVLVDKRRIERIVANLLVNADQHAGGPVRVCVETGAPSQHGRTVRLVVEDAGPGVPIAERERIFERFARGSVARPGVGTGLGLALVAEHAQLHGGRAWVEDRPNGGSRFIVELPARHS